MFQYARPVNIGTVDFSAYGAKSIRLKRLMLQQTGTYNDLYRRPYQMVMDNVVFDNVVKHLDLMRRVPGEALAAHSGQIIRPSALPETQIYVPNGWATSRMRFILIVDTESQMGAVTEEWVVGYTEFCDFSFGYNVDPRMVFYVDNISTVRRTERSYNFQGTEMVLSNPGYAGVMSQQQLYRMRPEDVLHKIDSSILERGLPQTSTSDFIDTKLTLNSDPIMARRENAMPVNFVSDLINGYVGAYRADGGQSDPEEIRTNAAHAISNRSATASSFISQISHVHGNIRSTFTYNDLLALDPSIGDRCIVQDSQGGHLHERGNTANWNDGSMEAVIATMVAQSLPAYMTQNALTRCAYSHRNYGMRDIEWHDIDSTVSARPEEGAMGLSHAIEYLMMPSLTLGNQMDLFYHVACDLYGDTMVAISINGSPIVQYVCPTYTSSLTAPLTTYNQDNLSHIARDTDVLLSQLTETIANPY